MASEWPQEVYESCVTSRCWWFTPYDDGWSPSLAADEELQELVRIEQALQPIPDWAREIVAGPLRHVAPCGHYRFPRSYRQVVQAIGGEAAPDVIHTCFVLDRERKVRLLDLVFCLDAWLAGASPEAASTELHARETGDVDWTSVCLQLWTALRDYTEAKGLLVERLIYQLRWWVKVSVSEDDLPGEWCPDSYVGDYLPYNELVNSHGNPQLAAPGWSGARPPRIKRLDARLLEACPEWPWFRWVISECTWPCAPKAFRYYEKLLWCIGRERQVISLPSTPLAQPEEVPALLGALSSSPEPGESAPWWHDFLGALDSWRRGDPPGSEIAREIYEELGQRTPVKEWLVRLSAHRFRILERDSGILHKLVSAPG